jgi:phytoene dehydrogenase-like protein
MFHGEVAVVGGGLAGLAGSLYLARGGRSVVLFEQSEKPGGRAATRQLGEYAFNQGPHALYLGGRGVQVLRELGIPIRGGRPRVSGGRAVRGGAVHLLPAGLPSILSTSLLSLGGKLEAARAFARLPRVSAAALDGISVSDWLDRTTDSPRVRELLLAFIRVATYANDPERMSAGAALRQLQLARKGVLYLDGGWQTLVDGLKEAALQSGVRIQTRAPVASIRGAAGGFELELGNGARYTAESVLLTGGPSELAPLLDDPARTALSRAAASTIPVRAACLDVALERLPRPGVLFALGIDRPLYYSVHSAAARLAPPGGALVHVARYLASDEPANGAGVGPELEGLLDLLQPGWRSVTVHRRLLPEMRVAHALPAAASSGLSGRPGPEILPGLYAAGDWVGAEGLLSDASLASARAAARAILAGRWRQRGAA